MWSLCGVVQWLACRTENVVGSSHNLLSTMKFHNLGQVVNTNVHLSIQVYCISILSVPEST